MPFSYSKKAAKSSSSGSISKQGGSADSDFVRFTYSGTEDGKSTFYRDGKKYTFEEGVKYTYYVQLAKTEGGLLDKDVVVTFAGMQARENEEDCLSESKVWRRYQTSQYTER